MPKTIVVSDTPISCGFSKCYSMKVFHVFSKLLYFVVQILSFCLEMTLSIHSYPHVTLVNFSILEDPMFNSSYIHVVS